MIANKRLVFQNEEKEKRAAELIIANEEIVFQNEEKEKRAAELIIANKELAFQNEEKEKRASELIIANKELVFQNKEKEKRAAELFIANNELVFNNKEKGKRAAELIIANKEIAFLQEKGKVTTDLIQRNGDLEQFSNIVSHNLNGPIGNITAITELLQKAGVDEHMKKGLIERLNVSSKKLEMVVKDLHDALQIKNNINKQKTVIEFAEITLDVTLSIENVINETGAKILTNFSDIGEMGSIKSYLYSIFYNLISNSIKYRQKDIIPVIKITSKQIGDTVELIFEDNGIGIDLKNSGSHVFGLYKRFHNHVEGSGVGLYMVKNQVEALGGKIFIESEVNVGTIFRIVFEDINKYAS